MNSTSGLARFAMPGLSDRKTSLFFLAILHNALAANILGFFPYPGKSHNELYRPIVERLAEKGHQITYVSPIPISNSSKNIKQIQLPNVIQKVHEALNLLEFGKQSIPVASSTLANMGLILGESLYGIPDVQKIIHSNENYDMVISESIFVQDPVSALAHKFNAMSVDISSRGDFTWQNELAGLPDNPGHMVDYKSPYVEDMNLIEKLHNTYITVASVLAGYYYQNKFQQQMDKYFNYTGYESRPSIGRMMSNKSLILVNSHHSTSYPSALAPHMKEIGGVHIRREKPLPQDLKNFIEGAEDGVIYFSLGSNLNMTEFSSHNILQSFTNVFGSLKQKVLWKWGSDELPKVAPNIKMSKWFPQQDILAHKNTKAFITHGGYLSISEAVHFGVPIIGIPFFSDQPKNMMQVHTKGYGIRIDRNNITEDSLKWAINEILNNARYKTEMAKRSGLFKDRQMEPVDEAVYWIEYVLRHGNVLQPKSVHLSFCALHLLDVIGISSICILVLSYLTKCLFRKLCKNVKQSKRKNKVD